MGRRRTTTRVTKLNQLRPDHVRGKGDIPYKGFACLNPICEAWIMVREDDIGDPFEITCGTCGYVHRSGDEQVFYNYELTQEGGDEPIESGTFGILVDDYVDEATSYKYCIVCCTLKPVAHFDRHSARRTGRQGECRLCKRVYNSIKNQTRTTDQHREAAQKRRLYLDITDSSKMDSRAVYERYGYQCFKCGVSLRDVHSESDRPLDHTLPASYLWPLSTTNATLLCRAHNAEKAGKWPSNYYTQEELKRLAVYTGWPYELLVGPPRYNPDALERLNSPAHVTALLAKYAHYMPEMLKLRNRILRDTGFDFFSVATNLSPDWIERANAERPSTQ